MITWLASYPKSGNTWVRLLLNAYLNESSDINNIECAMSDTMKYYYRAASPKADITPEYSLILRPCALAHIVEHYGPCILKTHNCNSSHNGLSLLPPALTAKAIYVMRDPRDVAISLAGHFGTTIDQAIDAMADPERAIEKDVSAHILGTWSHHVTSYTAARFPVLGVKYESLTENTERQLGRILEFIGIDPDPDRIEYAVNITQFDKIKEQEKKQGFKERSNHQKAFFNNGRSTWRETLTGEQVQRIESDHKEAMKRFNYQLVSEQTNERTKRKRTGVC